MNSPIGIGKGTWTHQCIAIACFSYSLLVCDWVWPRSLVAARCSPATRSDPATAYDVSRLTRLGRSPPCPNPGEMEAVVVSKGVPKVIILVPTRRVGLGATNKRLSWQRRCVRIRIRCETKRLCRRGRGCERKFGGPTVFSTEASSIMLLLVVLVVQWLKF
jgi:hypothetical protein